MLLIIAITLVPILGATGDATELEGEMGEMRREQVACRDVFGLT
jgi:hypothetical protein